MKVVNDIKAEDMYEMRRVLGWKEINLEQLKRGLKHTEYKVSVFENNEFVACGRIVSDYSCKGVLSDITVKPEYQGKGYGRVVLESLFEMVRNKIKLGERYQIEATPTAGNRDFYIKCGMKYKPENQDGTYLWIEKNVYKFHLLDKYFEMVKNGKKTSEIRIYDDKKRKMKIGEHIEFINNQNNETILVQIKNINIFNNLEDLYKKYSEKEIGVSYENIIESLEEIYNKNEILNNKLCVIDFDKK